MNRLATIAFVAGLASAAGGCAATPHLVATDGSHRMVAADAGSGLTVVLTTEVWESNNYDDELTIVHVLVSNMGPRPVLLAPGDFELRDERGRKFQLRDAGGSFAAVAAGTDPATVPAGEYDSGSTDDFRRVRSQDGELSRLALPWGTLLPGTQMRGFLYFDDVRERATTATLVWHVITPEHQRVADLGFKFAVADI